MDTAIPLETVVHPSIRPGPHRDHDGGSTGGTRR